MKMSFYQRGTEGRCNLFFRKKGTIVRTAGNSSQWDCYTAQADWWIVQWQGKAGYDSGYVADHFNNFCDAQEYFKDMERENDIIGPNDPAWTRAAAKTFPAKQIGRDK
jgi:hypothetical protein